VSEYIFKLPDLGEGTVEAEIVAWHVKPGDTVAEDKIIVEIMTDKAAVEVPSPVDGKVVSITGSPGDKVRVGSPLIVFETAAAAPAAQPAPTAKAAPAVAKPATQPVALAPVASAPEVAAPAPAAARAGRVMASPATRRRAQQAGIDLESVTGSGPGGRVTEQDLGRSPPAAEAAGITEVKVIGVRRVIAERLSESKRNIPHFAYVEEVDVTELEGLRAFLNAKLPAGQTTLSYLPLVVMALTRVLVDFPECNALYDGERGVILRHRGVHVGIATQTPDGLKVPVVRNAQSLDLWSLAGEIRAVSERARLNQSTRNELSGSTISVTSLGKLGGIASTPIINAPEVAIIGINKAVDRPMVQGGEIAVRRMMNISSSFDHRFVDGYNAAAMVQALKGRLEHPATLFIS
jgi:2-oxoisovalerate dehydrogenase E2 component (dihydrolipoyl transacylase)